jgi:hypothetical protein
VNFRKESDEDIGGERVALYAENSVLQKIYRLATAQIRFL